MISEESNYSFKNIDIQVGPWGFSSGLANVLRRIFFCSVAFLFVSILIGCSSHELRDEVNEDVSQIRNIQAQHTASLESLATEVRVLSGRIEEMEYSSKGKTKELEKTLAKVSSRVPPPKSVPEDLLIQDEQLIAAQAGEAAAGYGLALKKLRAADFPGALEDFTDFVTENPDTAFSDNALFWSGICQQSLGNSGKAISFFSEVFTKFPKEDFVAPSLYHLGLSFRDIGSLQESNDIFSKLSEDYPRSKFAAKARKELRRLKRRR